MSDSEHKQMAHQFLSQTGLRTGGSKDRVLINNEKITEEDKKRIYSLHSETMALILTFSNYRKNAPTYGSPRYLSYVTWCAEEIAGIPRPLDKNGHIIYPGCILKVRGSDKYCNCVAVGIDYFNCFAVFVHADCDKGEHFRVVHPQECECLVTCYQL